MPASLGTSNPTIRTLLLCDLVASTQLVERVGDSTAADLLARHDRFARDLLSSCNGREIDKSDGFLLLFERPIEAVRFAIAYQAKLREFGATFDSAMASRVGIHLGEVVLRENSRRVARGEKPLEVEGLAKAIAASVMSLRETDASLTRALTNLAARSPWEQDDRRCTGPFMAISHGGAWRILEICGSRSQAKARSAAERSEKARRAARRDTGNRVTGACVGDARPRALP